MTNRRSRGQVALGALALAALLAACGTKEQPSPQDGPQQAAPSAAPATTTTTTLPSPPPVWRGAHASPALLGCPARSHRLACGSWRL